MDLLIRAISSGLLKAKRDFCQNSLRNGRRQISFYLMLGDFTFAAN